MPRVRPRSEEVTIVKNVLWFVLGVAGGFAAAHLMNKDPRGHEVLAQVDARITEFTDRLGVAYREQEARFAGPAAEVKDAATTAFETARDAVASATGTAKEAMTSAAEDSADAAMATEGAAEESASGDDPDSRTVSS
ncbi:ATPase [Microbacterium lushaniae]|uniref:ATPase n=1 Tax=Microbacterium lushaniae TaxID=2614639 RepID=UPI001EE7B0B7|nr:ATPase [Microbacterium lushaniae]